MLRIKSFFHLDFPYNVTLRDLKINSTEVVAGDVFIALQGIKTNGLNYIDDAISHKCALILKDAPYKEHGACTLYSNIPIVSIYNLTALLAKFSTYFYDNPAKKIHVIGVTGTNGKTTTTYLISYLLNLIGKKAAFLGTIGNGDIANLASSKNTTESCVDIQRNLARFHEEGYSYVVMEVSSHGIAEHRIDGISFNAVVFTNLSHDHLNYHKTLENYIATKYKLFSEFDAQYKVLNLNTELGKLWQKNIPEAACYATYDISTIAKHYTYATHLSISGFNTSFLVKTFLGNYFLTINNLIGKFNLENFLAAWSTLEELGFNLAQLSGKNFSFPSIPGRMEMYTYPHAPLCIIDYAHTPDGVEKILHTLRTYTKGKLIIIFGFGGGRDISTRGEILQIVLTLADIAIYTTDNPRYESMEQIFTSAFTEHICTTKLSKMKVILDRTEAIRYAFLKYSPHDVVLLAGKGTENYQDILGVKYPYTDQEALSQAFKE